MEMKHTSCHVPYNESELCAMARSEVIRLTWTVAIMEGSSFRATVSSAKNRLVILVLLSRRAKELIR